MNFKEYVRLIRRNWRLIAAVTLASIAISAMLTATTTPVFRSTAQVFVSTPGGDTADLAQGSSFTQRAVATYADLMTTPAVLQPVIDELDLDMTATELGRAVNASVPPTTVLIDISVRHTDPTMAATLANSIAEQFTHTVRELEQIDESTPSPVKATVVRPALAPSDPVEPRASRNILLAAAVGLLLGVGLALARNVLDTRVVTEEDAKAAVDAPVIGAIAYDRDATVHPLIVQADPHSPRAEAFRTLRTNLQFIDAAERPRTIVLTSSMPGEGKTTTTANLALTMAASGSSVVVIEGDLRRPRLLDYMGMEGAIGLTNVLIGEVEVEDVLQPFGDTLTVLGAGTIPPNPSELLGSEAMDELLRRLENRFDFVIIDAPPLLPVTDAAVLSTLVDGAIVVVGSKIIRREQLERALTSLENIDARILGIVMNRLPVTGPDAYSYYADGYRPAKEAAPTRRSRRLAQEGGKGGLLSRK